MNKLVDALCKKFPEITFVPGKVSKWSPADKTIVYIQGFSNEQHVWALFHELAHAALEHNSYSSDLELLSMEVAAWDKAKTIAQDFSIEIEERHIQDCLDTYRDWLDQRSKCPKCDYNALSTSHVNYKCFNCGAVWHVSQSRFCRPYRKMKSAANKVSTTLS